VCDKGTVTTDVPRVARKLADRHKFPIIVDAKTVTLYVDTTIDVRKPSWDEARKGLLLDLLCSRDYFGDDSTAT